MDIRDAVASDAEPLAKLADASVDAMRTVIPDRTVRVAQRADADDRVDSNAVIGFVSFDAHRNVVHVTRLAGDADAFDRLLEEPLRFAEKEAMPVEVVVPEDEGDLEAVVENAGFEEDGWGPRFDGTPTRRYRLQPS